MFDDLGNSIEVTIALMIVGGFVLAFIYAIIRGVLFLTGRPAGRLIRKLARRHRDVLSEKWLRCHRQDEYGQPDRSQWLKEMDYFIQSTALPVMTDLQREWVSNSEGAKRCYDIITEVAAKHARTMKSVAPKSETEIAEILRQQGWSIIAVAGGTAGLVAEKDGMRVAIQAIPASVKRASPADLTVVPPDTIASSTEQLAMLGTAILMRDGLEQYHHHR